MTPTTSPEAARRVGVTYTPARYWHRIHNEIMEPKQTVTVERPVKQPTAKEPGTSRPSRYQTDPEYRERAKAAMRRYQQRQRAQQSPNLDWRGVPFPTRTGEAGR